MAHAELSLPTKTASKRAPKMGTPKRNAPRIRAGGLAISPCSAPTTSPTRSTRSSGTCARRRSRTRAARCSSSRPTAKSPAFWSQLATNVVVSKYFYGEVGTPEREHSVRQLDPPRQPARSPTGACDDGYFATRRRRRAVLSRADLALPAPARRVQLARLVQRRPVSTSTASTARSATGAGTPRRRTSSSPRTRTSIRKARPASSRASTTTWKTSWSSPRSEAMLFKFGSRHRHRPLDAPLASREALRRRQALAARCRSCGSTTRSPPS